MYTDVKEDIAPQKQQKWRISQEKDKEMETIISQLIKNHWKIRINSKLSHSPITCNYKATSNNDQGQRYTSKRNFIMETERRWEGIRNTYYAGMHISKFQITMENYLESIASILPSWFLEFPGLESWTCVTGKNLGKHFQVR